MKTSLTNSTKNSSTPNSTTKTRSRSRTSSIESSDSKKIQTKNCSSCKEEKVLTDFYKHKNYPDGYKRQCKDCENKCSRLRYDKAKLEGKVSIKNKKETNRAGHLKRTYGITEEQYQELLEKQNHECAICHKHESEFKKRFAVDHAHTSSKYVNAGMIRGLLCFNCNHLVIGRNTNADIYESAAKYLRQDTGLCVPENKIKPKRKRNRRKKIVR